MHMGHELCEIVYNKCPCVIEIKAVVGKKLDHHFAEIPISSHSLSGRGSSWVGRHVAPQLKPRKEQRGKAGAAADPVWNQ
jgi:hypothetical protein